jgi:hypothetical protein
MLQAITLYMSFVYGLVYLLFEAYPFVFVINHGFNSGENGLTFLGFFSGGALAVILYVYSTNNLQSSLSISKLHDDR